MPTAVATLVSQPDSKFLVVTEAQPDWKHAQFVHRLAACLPAYPVTVHVLRDAVARAGGGQYAVDRAKLRIVAYSASHARDDVPLWQTQGVRVCVRSSYRSSSSHSDVQTLWIGVSETPSTEDVERLMAVIFPWFDVVEGGVCLHIEHCETDHIRPPEVGTLLLIAAKLLEAKDRIDRSLVGTVVQARHLDGPGLMARDLFLGMYQPRKPLHIVQGRREARRCLEEVVVSGK